MNDTLLITNAHIVTPTQIIERGWLAVEAGHISAIASGGPPDAHFSATVDAQGLTLLPGFIDVHVHGALGSEAMDATPEALAKVAKYYAQHGVTSFLATTWSDSRSRIEAALANARQCVGVQPEGATLLGVHLEGPYLNPLMCGAQSLDAIRRADREEALTFLEYGVIRLISLAPEYPENHWLIEECARRGIVVSVAHTAATYEDVRHAITLGLTHATHTYNAMTGLHHRAPGTLGAVMVSPQVRCELIADNVHVHPGAMKLLWQVKGIDGVILITDSIRAAGMPDGEYMLDDRIFRVVEGVARLEDGTLAGSTLTLNRGLYNFMQAAGEPIERLWPVSSLNAARDLRVDDRKGSLEVGKDGDLVLVDQRINVFMTVVGGRIVYRQPQHDLA